MGGSPQAAMVSVSGSTGARSASIRVSGSAETRSEQTSVVLASASGGVIRTVCCPQPAATRSTTTAVPKPRFSTVSNPALPEPVSRPVGPPARPRSDGHDRTRQTTADTSQTLNPGHHHGAQSIHVLGLGPNHDVVGAGDVGGRLHPRDVTHLLCHPRSLPHVGLDQDICLHHTFLTLPLEILLRRDRQRGRVASGRITVEWCTCSARRRNTSSVTGTDTLHARRAHTHWSVTVP